MISNLINFCKNVLSLRPHHIVNRALTILPLVIGLLFISPAQTLAVDTCNYTVNSLQSSSTTTVTQGSTAVFFISPSGGTSSSSLQNTLWDIKINGQDFGGCLLNNTYNNTSQPACTTNQGQIQLYPSLSSLTASSTPYQVSITAYVVNSNGVPQYTAQSCTSPSNGPSIQVTSSTTGDGGSCYDIVNGSCTSVPCPGSYSDPTCSNTTSGGGSGSTCTFNPGGTVEVGKPLYLNANNLSQNEDYSASYSFNGKVTQISGVQNAGSHQVQGVTFEVTGIAQVGTYAGTVYDSSSKQICTTTTNVSDSTINNTEISNCQDTNTCDSSKPIPCNGQTGIQTAFGCIQTSNNLLDPQNAIVTIAKFAIGIGGAAALGLMIMGAFRMITSAGNPEAVTAGRQQFISAIIGLLFVIFAFTLLNMLANTILNLP